MVVWKRTSRRGGKRGQGTNAKRGREDDVTDGWMSDGADARDSGAER